MQISRKNNEIDTRNRKSILPRWPVAHHLAVRTISCWTVGVLSLALQRQAFIKPKEMTQPVLASTFMKWILTARNGV